MDKYRGTVFNFMEMETGELKKIWTFNGLAWYTKIWVPELDEDMRETDKLIEADQVIPYEVLMQKFKPASPEGLAFTKWCLDEVAQGLEIKIKAIRDYLASLGGE